MDVELTLDDVDNLIQEAKKPVDEGLRDYIRGAVQNYKSSRKVAYHIKRSGLSGRTPEEVASFMKKAALYHKTQKVLKGVGIAGAVAGGTAAMGGAMYAGKKLKQRAAAQEKRLQELDPRQRRLAMEKSRSRKYMAIGGALGAGFGAVTTGMQIRSDPVGALAWERASLGQKAAVSAVGAGLYGVSGALSGYSSAKQKESI